MIAGLYLVSVGQDQALVLWDVNERTCLEKRLLPGCATGLAWHPTKNALAVITEDGECSQLVANVLAWVPRLLLQGTPQSVDWPLRLACWAAMLPPPDRFAPNHPCDFAACRSAGGVG